MRNSFDRRVVTDEVLAFIRSCQKRAPCELGGGAALSGAYFAHRLSQDIDLFCPAQQSVRDLVRSLPDIATEHRVKLTLVRDEGSFVRAHCEFPSERLEVDIVVESPPDLAPPVMLEEISVRSLDDLRASKLTCLLSRSEPRDLVDVLFVERAGFSVESDLALALRKDSGIDPGVLAWLMTQFPTQPMPRMLEPLSHEDLVSFRDQLRERFRSLAMP